MDDIINQARQAEATPSHLQRVTSMWDQACNILDSIIGQVGECAWVSMWHLGEQVHIWLHSFTHISSAHTRQTQDRVPLCELLWPWKVFDEGEEEEKIQTGFLSVDKLDVLMHWLQTLALHSCAIN